MNDQPITIPADVAGQTWTLVDDGVGGRVSRSGSSFANLLKARGCYDDPVAALAVTRVGDVVRTGVSAYERTE